MAPDKEPSLSEDRAKKTRAADHDYSRSASGRYEHHNVTALGLVTPVEEKQEAVRNALMHSLSAKKSDRDIAKHVGVDQKTVLNWRQKLESAEEIPQIEERAVTRGASTYTQKTTYKDQPDRSSQRTVKLHAQTADSFLEELYKRGEEKPHGALSLVS